MALREESMSERFTRSRAVGPEPLRRPLSPWARNALGDLRYFVALVVVAATICVVGGLLVGSLWFGLSALTATAYGLYGGGVVAMLLGGGGPTGWWSFHPPSSAFRTTAPGWLLLGIALVALGALAQLLLP
jgi:hypothetical protein